MLPVQRQEIRCGDARSFPAEQGHDTVTLCSADVSPRLWGAVQVHGMARAACQGKQGRCISPAVFDCKPSYRIVSSRFVVIRHASDAMLLLLA